MGLPICVCPTSEETLPDGQVVVIRGLSRAEAIQIRELSPDITAMEVMLLKAGLNAPDEDVDGWYRSSASDAVEQLVTAITRLSGLDGETGKGEGDNSPSEKQTPLITNSRKSSTAA